MAKTRNTIIIKDTRQTKLRNKKSTSSNDTTKKESVKSVKNSRRNDQNSVSLDDIDTDQHRLTVEIEIDKQDTPNDNKATGIALNIMEGLLEEWIKTEMI